jgi:hypothetical protein
MLQYTYIFSNEDGGTNTPQLMARWGRTTDIEHVYRLFLSTSGAAVGAIFQGVNHKETPFRGRKVGDHLLLGVASRNNNFSDAAGSGVRMALWPQMADLSQHSREDVMDREPWTYRIMAGELEREGKLKEIADPRQFLYLQARLANSGSAASFSVALKDGRTFRSDRGRADMRIERSGWVRSATELPAGTRFQDLAGVQFNCDLPAKPPPNPPAEPFCAVDSISKMFFLDQDYRPGPSGAVKQGLPARIKPGQSVRF